MSTEHKSALVTAGIHLQRVFPSWLSSPAWVTRLSRRDADRYNPDLVSKFIKDFRIDFTRATQCSNADDRDSCAAKYGTLNAFFQRKERGVTASAAYWLCSPATGMAVLFESFPDSGVWVKGRQWSLARLLGEGMQASRLGKTGKAGVPRTVTMDSATDRLYDSYRVCIVRLRPSDYHRFHAPFAGTLTEVVDVPGGYLSVDPLIVKSKDVLSENHRVVFKVQVDGLGAPAYVVAVGAAIIGSVIPSVRVGQTLAKGDDMGSFAFGGSTVVVAWPAIQSNTNKAAANNKNNSNNWPQMREDIVFRSLRGKETYVTVGDSLGPVATAVADRRRNNS